MYGYVLFGSLFINSNDAICSVIKDFYFTLGAQIRERNMKSGFTNNALGILAFIIAFLAVKYGMQVYREHQAVAKVEQSISQMQTEAAQKHPDVPASIALQQVAIEQAYKKMASETDVQKRASSAADMFWGFYFINVRERPEFCREQDTDIQPFVKAFENGHIKELAQAKTIYARSSVDENKLYALLKSQFRKMIQQDMNDIATANKVTLKEACQLISENGESLAKEMHLSKAQPAVYQALFSPK